MKLSLWLINKINSDGSTTPLFFDERQDAEKAAKDDNIPLDKILPVTLYIDHNGKIIDNH